MDATTHSLSDEVTARQASATSTQSADNPETPPRAPQYPPMSTTSTQGAEFQASGDAEGMIKAEMVTRPKLSDAPNFGDRLSNELWTLILEQVVIITCSICYC